MIDNSKENETWLLYQEKARLMLGDGARKGLVKAYGPELLLKLRNVYYGGLPASVLLYIGNLCGGYCYDRALLITLGFDEEDEFQLVDANINSVLLNPFYIERHRESSNKNWANHCFAERVEDGITWVYDTTKRFKIEKGLYYKLENPQVTEVNDKQTVMNYIEYQEIKSADIERDKYLLPFVIPYIEETIEHQEFDREIAKYELETFKGVVHYDDIFQEIEADMLVKGFK